MHQWSCVEDGGWSVVKTMEDGQCNISFKMNLFFFCFFLSLSIVLLHSIQWGPTHFLLPFSTLSSLAGIAWHWVSVQSWAGWSANSSEECRVYVWCWSRDVLWWSHDVSWYITWWCTDVLTIRCWQLKISSCPLPLDAALSPWCIQQRLYIWYMTVLICR